MLEGRDTGVSAVVSQPAAEAAMTRLIAAACSPDADAEPHPCGAVRDVRPVVTPLKPAAMVPEYFEIRFDCSRSEAICCARHARERPPPSVIRTEHHPAGKWRLAGRSANRLGLSGRRILTESGCRVGAGPSAAAMLAPLQPRSSLCQS